MERQKVLFLITKSNWGGAQRYVYDLATSLDTHLYEPVVALGGDGTLKEMLEAAGVRTIAISGLQRDFSLKKELLSSFAIANIIRKEDPDILHVNSSKAGGIGTFLGRILFVPRVIFTAHGWAFNEKRPCWQKIIIKFLHWLTVLFSHHTIAVSNGLKNQLRWPGAAKKMTVINPGRTITNLKEKSEAREHLSGFAPQLAEYKNDLWIGTIAELHPIKRLDLAIESMVDLVKANPNLRYVIIGSGELRAELEIKINNLNLNDNIFLTGSITEAGHLLKSFDIFVLPSRSESYGYVLLEAGWASLPVVANNVGGIPDIITHNENGWLIESENKKALTEALDKLINDETLRHKFGNALKERVTTLSVASMTSQTCAVYEGTNSRA